MESSYWRLESSKNNSLSKLVYYHRSAAWQIVSPLYRNFLTRVGGACMQWNSAACNIHA